MTSRERRSWTEAEDNLLRSAVQREDADCYPPTNWRAIAKHIPNRNNKDCRKRWFAKMAFPVARGGWSADEDDRLIKAIQKYGTRWSLVAAAVGTRNSNQCAKRWSDTLSPDIDKTSWTPEEDVQLLAAVVKHGTLWTHIVKIHFPGRTGLSAKNRYARLSRLSTDPVDGDRHYHHANRQRSSSLSSYPLIANNGSSQLQPESGYPPSANCSDTTSRPGSSSCSMIERPSSQTPEQEYPKFMEKLEQDFSGLQMIQFPSYGLAGTTERTDEAFMFTGSNLFCGTNPSIFIQDFLHSRAVQPQGLNLHPYEVNKNEVHFPSCNPCPTQVLHGAAQLASQSLGPRLFDNQSSLYPQSAYNIPSAIDFSHTAQLACNTSNVHNTYSMNNTRELPPSSIAPLPSFPHLYTGTPNFTPPAELSIHNPIGQVNEPVADDAQDLTFLKQVADPSWNLSNSCSRTFPLANDGGEGYLWSFQRIPSMLSCDRRTRPSWRSVTFAIAM